MARATCSDAKFPTVEIDAGRYLSDSDRLIDHFARRHNINATELPTFSFYKETIFPQLDELHKND